MSRENAIRLAEVMFPAALRDKCAQIVDALIAAAREREPKASPLALSQVLGALRGLVAALPRCSHCICPAVRAYPGRPERYCDVHRDESLGAFAADPADLPRAQAIRQVLKVLGVHGALADPVGPRWSSKSEEWKSTMDIGQAVEELKVGSRVARAGWNGRGMWLIFVPGEQWSTSVGPSDVQGAHRLPWVGMKTADGGLVPWLCSQTDLLADDWQVV